LAFGVVKGCRRRQLGRDATAPAGTFTTVRGGRQRGGGRTGEGGRVGERIDPMVVAAVGRTGPMGGNGETWTPAPRRNAQNVA